MRFAVCRTLLLGLWAVSGLALNSHAQQRLIPLEKLQSGLHYSGAEVQSLQTDEFANPGNIALDSGTKSWAKPDGKSNKSCQSCHGDLNCRVKNQKAAEWAFESDELVAMTLAVTSSSRGLPLQAQIDGAAKSYFENGQRLFMTRQGQMNLACTNCHDQHYGQKLYTDPLSQGQANGYPLYRIDWQRVASLERRLRFCYTGVKADIPPWGHSDIRDISLYLMWRGQGLLVEAPAVRK